MNRFLPLVQIIFLPAGVLLWQPLFKFIEESDTYFAMNLGRYILEHGFPHVDPFTIHENLQLVAQQWLSGVLFWQIYKDFGVDGFLILDALIGAASVLIYWRLCFFVSGGNKVLSFAMSFVVGFLISAMIVPRPHIFSALLLLIEVFLLEKFTRTENFKFLLPLPLLSMLLANFHAAMWLMSLVVCLPFLFVKSFRHVKFLLAAMAGIFLGGLINPYGVDALTYVFRSYGVDLINANIPEMHSPTAQSFRGKFFYLTETLLIFSLARFKVPWRYIFLSGGITFMALMHGRNLPLFYFLATFPLAYVWRELTTEKIFKQRALSLGLFFLLIAANTAIVITVLKEDFAKIPAPLETLFAISMLAMIYNVLVLRLEKTLFHPTILPRKILSLIVNLFIVSGIFFFVLAAEKTKPPETYTAAINFILRTERPENISLYAEQGIGGLAGSFGIKYYIDSRSEVFLAANNGQKDIFEEYIDFSRGKINYKDFFRRYDFTHIILTNDTPFIFDELSGDKNFRVIYESERVDGTQVTRCKVFVPKKD
ncbi:MAG: hypothetical protein IKG61_08125 [Selenomonadaceae bacterium]|nr:hypothetical protein [Selenomonadaceae bacterium]